MTETKQPAGNSDEKRDFDPSLQRSVPSKRANQPYLVHQQYLAKERRKEQVKKAREEGRTLPPSDLDEEESAPLTYFLGLSVVVLVVAIALGSLSGMFFTNDPLWGYRGKWSNWRTYIPQHEFTMDRLMVYNGDREDLPILLSIKGDVFDVSAGRLHYSQGSPYHNLAGRDASRAFTTGCFETHLTHDLRGLSSDQLKSLDAWHKFFQDHHTYHKVGRARLPPIDPASPIPEPCRFGRPQRS
ncbi:hypothetical protein MPSI1_003306 [Malassezia psittaci]|uniref:Cytochrome b5 heme-binding domain-containing protein n=1 Tax=Malassezia psittaci TaxID=1821823 RepID=A0AAF0FEF4_9BASI|nr:hypothetical protein MPSI1_003306 [Malassezia psittaci]